MVTSNQIRNLAATDMNISNAYSNTSSRKVEWTEALLQLTKIMFTLTGQKTIVLVDEYDTPMSEALAHGYLEQVTTPPWFKISSHIYPGQFLFQVHI